MSHYLVYWKPQTVLDNQCNTVLEHSASEQYGKVRIGDVLWIVTSEEPDDLLLVGRQRVDQIIGQAKAEQIYGPGVWMAKYHVISFGPEAMAYLDISPWARRLAFDGVVESLPRGFTGQHLQAMRRLAPGSVRLLKRLWARRNE